MKQKYEYYIVVILIAFILSISSLNSMDVYAQHPYVGGYFSGNVITTTHVIMGTNFPIVDTSAIPDIF
ncbi:hypothetical protein DRN87_06080 [Candidatus Geothermarchaeota archaeon]|nr:MAG: hypothetical protein DRN87_06080 [Candidatus Geothermarchaeota archaeon]